jgi:hypothetical protein
MTVDPIRERSDACFVATWEAATTGDDLVATGRPGEALDAYDRARLWVEVGSAHDERREPWVA